MIVGLTLLVTPMATFLLWKTVAGVFEENHIVETAQAVLLFLAVLIHVREALLQMGQPRTFVLFHSTLALLCLSLFAREFDVDAIGTQNFWALVETVFRVFIVLLWISLGSILIAGRNELWQRRFILVLGKGSRFVYAGILLYGCSWFFDKEAFALTADTALYFEETLQLVATLCFFFGALFFPLVRETGMTNSSD